VSLKKLDICDSVKTRAVMHADSEIIKVLLEALPTLAVEPAQWTVTLLFDMMREDAACYATFEEALKKKVDIFKPLMAVLESSKDAYVVSKTAWILTAVIGNTASFFSDAQVKAVVSALKVCEPVNEGHFDVELPKLEAITNLMKADSFRGLVWEQPGVRGRIFSKGIGKASSPYLYKTAFAIWMVSFDPTIMAYVKAQEIQLVGHIKEILGAPKVEKVVRLCLTVLRNLLADKALCVEVVENGFLEIVQQLEFEKWRDAELYDDIRDMTQLISTEVNELSNFDRYERELHTGKLKWGFIHSSKFWAENVMKFEKDDYSAIKELADVLKGKADATTLAVACHDVGQFVALHPLGKKVVGRLLVQSTVMKLMSSEDPQYREVRREALLCCQKLMLNKWQDIDASR